MRLFCRCVRPVAVVVIFLAGVSAANGQTSVRIRVESNVAYSPAEQIKRFFTDGGMRVVETDNPDLSIEVEFYGSALSQSYSMFAFGTGTRYYTGANVGGTFLVETKNRPASTREFSGEIVPPSSLPGGSGPGSPAGAPFERAFINTSSFFSQMAEVLRETFDSTAMTTFWLGVMKNPSHAKLAKERLAMLGPIAATPVLNAMRSGSVSSVKDDDGIAILAELRDPSVLVPFLTDPDLKVRKAVATVLSRKADDRFNTPLAQVLATEKDASIRVVAASGLVGASAAEALTKALSDLDVGVRLASIEGLAKAGDSQALSKAAKQDKDPKVRAAAVQAFARVKNPPTDSLLLALNDPDSGVKRAAAEVLGGLTDKTAVRPLIVAMQGQPISTRRAISETLKKLTGEDLGMDQQAWTKWWQGQPKN